MIATTRGARKPGGFTLIEILAALGMIAIVIPIVMQGFDLTTSAAVVARQRVEAATLADSKLNELIATDGWKLGLLSGDFDDHKEYHWSAEMSNWDSSTLQVLSVRVTWQFRGQQKEFVCTTLVDGGS